MKLLPLQENDRRVAGRERDQGHQQARVGSEQYTAPPPQRRGQHPASFALACRTGGGR